MSKWNDLINRYNPNEDDLCDLLDKAEKIGRAEAFKLVADTFGNGKIIMVDRDYFINWMQDQK